MKTKKDFPLIILKALEPFVGLKGQLFEVVESKDSLLLVIDKDSDSNFHFEIEKYQHVAHSNSYIFTLTQIPKSQNNNGPYNASIDVSRLGEVFNTWVKLLQEYEQVSTFFDDPIVEKFSNEFFSDFEIVDEDAETSTFDTNQILFLDSYLEKLEQELLDYNNKQPTSIGEITNEIQQLRDNLTIKSKKWVVKALTRIWGKIAKQGPKLIKVFLTAAKREVIKQLVQGSLGTLKDHWHQIL